MRYRARWVYTTFIMTAVFICSSYKPPPVFAPEPILPEITLNIPSFKFIEPGFNNYNDPVITSDSASSTIQFSRAGNLILIRAKADTTEGFFILDTGAPYLILNMTYFRGYPGNSNPEGAQGGITGSVTSATPTRVKKLSMGGFHYHGVEADRINLGHIEDSKGVKILGLLGMQLFKRFEMIIDYENNLIHLHLIQKKEAKTYKSEMLRDPSTYNTFPIIIKDNKLLINAVIGGKTLSFVIDTGAESNIIDSRLPNKVFNNITINRRVLLAGNGQKKIEALYGDMSDFKIGDVAISTLPFLVTNLEDMCTAYNVSCLDGMLGFDFLSLHKIGFNFVTRKMYIWK